MLSERDEQLIREFDERLQIVRDRTRGVAEGWHTGFYLWGEGGISKSYTVIQELDRLEVPYKVTNSRLTGKGLFELLAEAPDMVHVLEDMESLCRSPNASGVLRSALWHQRSENKTSQQHPERLVTWRTAKEKSEIIFTGGIVLTMNASLDDLPELRAVKTRIAHLHLQPTNDEIAAKMREISLRGYRHGTGKLTPDECLEVCEYLIDILTQAGKSYDFRMLVNGFHDRLQYEADHSQTHWHDMLESRLKERVTRPTETVSREAKIGNERAIALEIEAMKIPNTEKLRLWKERTGKSQAAYYRRLKG